MIKYYKTGKEAEKKTHNQAKNKIIETDSQMTQKYQIKI